jgi:hypothetical protein
MVNEGLYMLKQLFRTKLLVQGSPEPVLMGLGLVIYFAYGYRRSKLAVNSRS